jgi:nucleotide-binding universal stress UspA family protein
MASILQQTPVPVSVFEELAMEFRHVLVPTDFSGDARRPLEWGVDLGSKVTLLHVVRDLKVVPPGATIAPPISAPGIDEEVAAAKRDVAELAAACEGEVDGVVVTGGDVARSITTWAEENEIDLIALSTHGRTGFRRMVLGSIAEAVLRHATVPVMCFPKKKD